MVTEILDMQTRLMESWDGSAPDVERIRDQAEKNRPPKRFEVIYNCPFTGFLDRERTRAGCLFHPGTGDDLRDYCQYGHRTCSEARCTAYTYLDPNEARAVMEAGLDWYCYGLCITDIDLVKDFFELAEMKLVRPVDPGRVAREPNLAKAFGDYLGLKEDWPFARDPGRFGKYYFVGKNYHIYMIDYRAMGVPRPFHDGILSSLASVIETGDELQKAVEIIDGKVDAFVRQYSITSKG